MNLIKDMMNTSEYGKSPEELLQNELFINQSIKISSEPIGSVEVSDVRVSKAEYDAIDRHVARLIGSLIINNRIFVIKLSLRLFQQILSIKGLDSVHITLECVELIRMCINSNDDHFYCHVEEDYRKVLEKLIEILNDLDWRVLPSIDDKFTFLDILGDHPDQNELNFRLDSLTELSTYQLSLVDKYMAECCEKFREKIVLEE